MKQVYLDNNATTRPNTEMLSLAVAEAGQFFGNPSSLHLQGQSAKEILERSRRQVACYLKTRPSEIVFTSGGTEANNLALSGFCKNYDKVVSSTEHSSVFKLSSQEVIHVTQDGLLDFDSYNFSTIGSKSVVSVMLANNETGVILDPFNRLFELKEKYGFLLHVDAVQAFGKVPLDLSEGHIDFLSISAHKMHGLKGIGALYVNRGTQERLLSSEEKFNPLMLGGAQERGYRPGTENILGAFSLGYISEKNFCAGRYAVAAKRDRFEAALSDVSKVNGSVEYRVCNTSNLFFPNMPGGDSELFLEILSERGVFASSKSACSSGMTAPSRVLTMMFKSESSAEVNQSIRFSLSSETTDEEIDTAVDIIKDCLV